MWSVARPEQLNSSLPLVKVNILGHLAEMRRIPSVTEPSEYLLEPLREGADFILYRGRQRGNLSPILAVGLAAEQLSPQSLRRLEHEYSLAGELDPTWAA
jgi:hypothetical protein